MLGTGDTNLNRVRLWKTRERLFRALGVFLRRSNQQQHSHHFCILSSFCLVNTQDQSSIDPRIDRRNVLQILLTGNPNRRITLTDQRAKREQKRACTVEGIS